MADVAIAMQSTAGNKKFQSRHVVFLLSLANNHPSGLHDGEPRADV
jgi:hypothetical protein